MLIFFFFSETKNAQSQQQCDTLPCVCRGIYWSPWKSSLSCRPPSPWHWCPPHTKERNKKKNPLSTQQRLRQISSKWQSQKSTLADLLLLLFPLLVARLAVRVLRGSVELTSVLSDQDVNRALYGLVPPQGLLVQNLFFFLLSLWCATSILCWQRTIGKINRDSLSALQLPLCLLCHLFIQLYF